MNKDISRKLIAIVANKKLEGYTKNDFLNTLSFKRALLPPDLIDKFITGCIEDKLLIEKNNKYLPNFSTDGVIVPLDFSVNVNSLFSDAEEKPLVDRLLEAASASGKMTKKEAIIKAKELLSGMEFIDFEIALLTVLSNNNININEFVKEKEETLNKN